LKRIFKDLFERQAFEDDGVYDWDIIKKQQEKGATSYIMPGEPMLRFAYLMLDCSFLCSHK
jgi:hypothetical protein